MLGLGNECDDKTAEIPSIEISFHDTTLFDQMISGFCATHIAVLTRTRSTTHSQIRSL